MLARALAVATALIISSLPVRFESGEANHDLGHLELKEHLDDAAHGVHHAVGERGHRAGEAGRTDDGSRRTNDGSRRTNDGADPIAIRNRSNE